MEGATMETLIRPVETIDATVADEVADDLLLSVARTDKPKRVATEARHTVRAWVASGGVD